MSGLVSRWRARRAVVLAAKCVESGFEPDLDRHPFDPDDLNDLVKAVRDLRMAEAA